jgi:hypothetical protein
MKLDELDHELGRLRTASERVAANLVDLEIDSGRQLLEASPLTGESLQRWSAASAALTDLWEWRALLDAFLQRAEELRRTPRRADQLKALLTGPSIELTRSPVPLAERHLLANPEVAATCTADQLLARMSRSFDEVKTVVARFGQAWEALTPRLGEARAILDHSRALADSLGGGELAELTQAATRLGELSSSVATDPLRVDPHQLDRLTDSLRVIERDLEGAATLRRDFDARLGDARAQLARLHALLNECRVAHEELRLKISVPTASDAPELPDDVDRELDDVAGLARSGAWREARRRLDDWSTRTNTWLQQAEGILHANRAPLDARNQLRALLEAYQIKAGRLGAIEDRQLEEIFAQAHEALYTAPTDLTVAAQLVRAYQELLNSPRTRSADEEVLT